MSNTINNDLLERASEMMEQWAGTMHERIIQRDIDAFDLEALAFHVKDAEIEACKASIDMNYLRVANGEED